MSAKSAGKEKNNEKESVKEEKNKDAQEATLLPQNDNGQTDSSGSGKDEVAALKARVSELEKEVASLREQLCEAEVREAYVSPVFGVALEKLMPQSAPGTLPRLHYVFRVIGAYLRRDNGLSTQGLFRIPAGQDEVAYYKRVLDSGQPLRFGKGEQLVAAGLLKQLLRELPEPLIPKLYDAQVPYVVEQHKSSADKSALIAELRDVIASLPPAHLAVLRSLVGLLVEIAARAKENLMTVENLIKCIVPTVGCHPALFSYPMRHYAAFFGTEDAPAHCVLADEEAVTMATGAAEESDTNGDNGTKETASSTPRKENTETPDDKGKDKDKEKESPKHVRRDSNSKERREARGAVEREQSTDETSGTGAGASKKLSVKDAKAKKEREKEEKERKEREEKERKEREKREKEEEKERKRREKEEKEKEKEREKKAAEEKAKEKEKEKESKKKDDDKKSKDKKDAEREAKKDEEKKGKVDKDKDKDKGDDDKKSKDKDKEKEKDIVEKKSKK